MFGFLTRPLDRLAIRSATASVEIVDECGDAAAAERLLRDPDLFRAPASSVRDLSFRTKHDFQFSSPAESREPENRIVHGKLYRAGKEWHKKPSVILLHGWNGELGYWRQFPYLAWRLNRWGVNAAMFELPYHAQRRPLAPNAIRNFISHDLVRMIEATQQALADARALLGWLEEQGSPRIGFWGVSLGGWLAGLLACHEPRSGFSVLMTPVNRMDRAIKELEFCEAIRRSLGNATLSLEPLNLLHYRPLLDPQRILLIQSNFDLFAPRETVEELWQAWCKPHLWRYRHGHISILMSVPVMERTARWVARTASAAQ
ncbi:MAG: alpha/beta fold hydrolase [Verrucomicrobia subdivision 3 bacterium]|nr:alpha/beta fold hydrolase [Limisphaerales bacterium]